MKLGDTITIANQYKKRTFRQWLNREPREIKKFTIVSKLSGQVFERKEKAI